MALIYIVEDDANIAELITATLGAIGHEPRHAACAAELTALLVNDSPQLLLLDLMLPDTDGLTLLTQWRESSLTAHIPVIIISAKGTELDKVRGLELGAEDYITKPFGILELQARIKTALRRQEQLVPECIQWSDLTFHFTNKEVFKNGDPLHLTFKEYQLLAYLYQHMGQVLTRSQLLENVWGYRFAGDTTRTVDFHIASLRQKLGDQADYPRYIETVRGYGYRLKRIIT